MRLLVIAFALAAGTAAAQTGDAARDASRPAPRQHESRAGTVTNPPPPGSIAAPDVPAGEPEAPESRAAKPGAPHADGAARQQAESKRREALEHCQTMTGASRTDCVRRADEEFRRSTSDDTLSDGGPDPSLG
jgi:hypothetical protein